MLIAYQMSATYQRGRKDDQYLRFPGDLRDSIRIDEARRSFLGHGRSFGSRPYLCLRYALDRTTLASVSSNVVGHYA